MEQVATIDFEAINNEVEINNIVNYVTVIINRNKNKIRQTHYRKSTT